MFFVLKQIHRTVGLCDYEFVTSCFCVCMCVSWCAYALYWHCVCVILCVCGGGWGAHVRVWAILCACVFAMLCTKILIFICFILLYTTDLYNYGYLRIVCFSLSSTKTLYKFPIIITVHLNYPPKWCGLLAAPTGCGWDMAGAIVGNCCQLCAHSVHYTINNRRKTGWKWLTCAEAWPAGMSTCCVLCAGPCSGPLWDWTGGTAVLPTQPPATTNAATNCWLARHGNTNTAIMENSSVQFKVVSMPSEKLICTPPCLSDVSTTLPSKQFQCASDWDESPLWLSSFQGRLSCASSFQASLLQAINGVMSLVVSQVPQHNHWLVINWFLILSTEQP